VPEVARDYLEGRTRYDAADVMKIAELQQRAEDEALAGDTPIVVADTDYQILELWWQERFAADKTTQKAKFEVLAPDRSTIDTSYLLCYPDLEWQPDPLRENPFDRDRLFAIQMQMLERISADFRVIWGQGAHRNRLARDYVEAALDKFARKKVAL